MTKIIFSGYYGELNTGDDAFCAVVSWIVQNNLPYQPLFMADDLPVLPFPGRLMFQQKQQFKGQNKLRLLFSLIATRRVVFAGGSIFHGHEGWTRRYIEQVDSIISLRMGAIGVSLGPFRDNSAERRVENFLRRFSFLVLRDRHSYDIALEMDLPYKPIYGFDLAGLLPAVYPKVNNNSTRNYSNLIGIIPCCHNPQDRSGQLSVPDQRLLETVKCLEEKPDIRFRLFTFNGSSRYGDGPIVQAIAALIADKTRVEIIPYLDDPGAVYSLVSECKSVLSVRLHGAVFALMAGVPFCLGEYHRKCTDFLDESDIPNEYRIGFFDRPPIETAELLSSMSPSASQSFKSANIWQKRAEMNISALLECQKWN